MVSFRVEFCFSVLHLKEELKVTSPNVFFRPTFQNPKTLNIHKYKTEKSQVYS